MAKDLLYLVNEVIVRVTKKKSISFVNVAEVVTTIISYDDWEKMLLFFFFFH